MATEAEGFRPTDRQWMVFFEQRCWASCMTKVCWRQFYKLLNRHHVPSWSCRSRYESHWLWSDLSLFQWYWPRIMKLDIARIIAVYLGKASLDWPPLCFGPKLDFLAHAEKDGQNKRFRHQWLVGNAQIVYHFVIYHKDRNIVAAGRYFSQDDATRCVRCRKHRICRRKPGKKATHYIDVCQLLADEKRNWLQLWKLEVFKTEADDCMQSLVQIDCVCQNCKPRWHVISGTSWTRPYFIWPTTTNMQERMKLRRMLGCFWYLSTPSCNYWRSNKQTLHATSTAGLPKDQFRECGGV